MYIYTHLCMYTYILVHIVKHMHKLPCVKILHKHIQCSNAIFFYSLLEEHMGEIDSWYIFIYIELTDLPVLRTNCLVSCIVMPTTRLSPKVESRECLHSDFSVYSPGVARSVLPVKEERWPRGPARSFGSPFQIVYLFYPDGGLLPSDVKKP